MSAIRRLQRTSSVSIQHRRKALLLTFFESLLVLLAVAIALLQISRRLSIPYPTMLAAAGVILALVPGAPKISLDPHMALALFISPAIVDAAFDFPIAAIRRYWRPLFALAVVAVLLTAAAVAWLGSVNMPRRTVTIIKGESLLNDATALLLFSMAVALQNQGAITGGFALQLGLAAPGGILLGIGVARLFLYVRPLLDGTRGANLSEFVGCFSLWIIAEHLKLSAVLCTVAFAMTLATKINLTNPPRMRIHSFAVWDAAVFSLNVFAFLLMGFQARAIIGAMTPDRLEAAGWFAGAVVACLIGVRLLWLLIYNRLAARFQWLRGDLAPASLSQGVLVGWCGMRGLVTLATAFSLPATFPQRDLIVLTAFAVVLATLIIQGLSLPALIHLLKLDGDNGLDRELADIRADLANVALETLGETKGRSADFWRYEFEIARTAAMTTAGKDRLEEKRRLGLQALHRQRDRLEVLRNAEQAGSDAYLIVQEELDFAEVSLTSEQDRRIEES